MSLGTGARLGPYEITGKLGEGGMGEVYRATDSRLRRQVAIKVLPAAFTADQERLARFEREAQLLAQLQHPHIASIYGLEETDGVRALVMELVEGEDLSILIGRGPLALDEALAIARQIAEALEAAHGQGIVHRDLKPQNVKVRSDGSVKVLDFGLAKALDAGAGSAALARSPTLLNSPTLTAAGTQLGVILGTAAYMAPEQARGGAVDRRADIWAFGVVLYEMLAGRSLFAGETVTDTLAGVLKTEIDFTRLPASVPAEVRRLLRRCLERNPKSRLHDIADARIVLDELGRGLTEEAAPAAPAPARSRAALLAAAGALALLIGIAAGWLARRPASESFAASARWALAIPDGWALSPDQVPQLAISEDGRLQAAVIVDGDRRTHLTLRSSEELAPRILPETEGASSPFFSPDGAWIGFFDQSALVKMPVGGGPPVELAAVGLPGQYRGASWSRDGFIYFVPNVAVGISKVSENGGAVTVVTTIDPARDERTHRWPQVLPDGGAVLFTADTFASTEFYDDARIEAVRTADGERRVLVEGASMARFVPGAAGGHLVFARGGSLYAVAFDPLSLAVRGAPELAVQGVSTDVSSGAVQFAVSRSGAAVWAPGALSAQYELFWIGRDGAEAPVGIPAAAYNEVDLSPDGKRVALIGGQGGAADLWIADLERGTQSRLTAGESVVNPVWTPDGSRVAYTVRVAAAAGRLWRIAWKLADGSRDAEVLLESAGSLNTSAFTPDGARLLYSASRDDGGTDLYLLPVGGGQPEPLLAGPFSKREATVSPDGRFYAYTSNESGGGPNVFVRPFPSGEGRWQVSVAGGFEARWSRDRRELYYRGGFDIYRVAVDTRGAFSAGRAERVADRVSPAVGVRTYGLAPDGRIFTPRSPAVRDSARTVYLDLGFARRLEGKSGQR